MTMSTMASSVQFPFNDLPIELQREVFVLAAHQDRGSVIRLVLVARRFYQWISPHLYHLVTLGAVDGGLFLTAMHTRSDSQSFFVHHVKKLCLSVSVNPRHAEQILRRCTGVHDLAFWVDYLPRVPNGPIVQLISRLPLRRLSIELEHFTFLFREPEVRHAWLGTLTHLDIIFWHHELSPTIPYLERLSSLTHLAMRLRHNQPTESSLIAILSACRNLKILIIYDDDSVEEAVWVTDVRVVFVPYPTEVVYEWESRARDDELCSWRRAEELVRRKVADQNEERQAAGASSSTHAL